MQSGKNILQLFFRDRDDLFCIRRRLITDRIQELRSHRDTAASYGIITCIRNTIQYAAHTARINVFLVDHALNTLSVSLEQTVFFQIHQISLIDHIGIVCKQCTHNINLLSAGKRQCYGLVVGTGIADLEFHFDIVLFSQNLVNCICHHLRICRSARPGRKRHYQMLQLVKISISCRRSFTARFTASLC